MRKPTRTFTFVLALTCLISTAGCGHAAPTQSPSTDKSATENPQAAPEGASELIPAAVMIGSSSSLALVGTDQGYIGSLYFGDTSGFSSDNVIPVGKFNSGESNVPVLFTSYSAGADINYVNGGQSKILRSLGSLTGIAGSDGGQAVAFADATYSGSSLKSSLYVADVNDIGLTASVHELDDSMQQWALKPLAVDTADGQASGVWYTTTGWGVGGPGIFFPITQGLNYYDVKSGSVTEYLGNDQSLQGLSPDHQLAGSIESSSSGDHEMTVTNLSNHWSMRFPLKASSDQGSGYAVFSPDDQYAAWLEVGSSSYDASQYNYVVRIGNLSSSKTEFEIDTNAVGQELNKEITYLKPVGWLNNNILLIEARGTSWDDAYVVQMSLKDKNVYSFAIGSFVGFVY